MEMGKVSRASLMNRRENHFRTLPTFLIRQDTKNCSNYHSVIRLTIMD